MPVSTGAPPANGKPGDEVADEGDAKDGQQDIPGLQDDRVGGHQKVAGHLDEAEPLLKQGETDAGYESRRESE